MAFSATESAFEGFRVVRRNPLVILWWSLAYLIFFAVLLAAVGGPILAMLPQLQALEGSEPSMDELMPILNLYGTILLIAMPLGILLGAVLNAAVARSVLSPGSSAFGFMRLGMDEVRVAVVTFVLALVFMAIYVALVGVVAAATMAVYSANEGAGVAVGILGGLTAIFIFIWMAIRLSLAVPIVVAENRFAFFDSWGLTKGRFWSLLGMTLIAFVMAIVVSVLGAIIAMPLQFMGMAGFEQTISGGEMESILAAIGPVVIVAVIVNLIISTLQFAVLYAPFASAYLGLTGRGGDLESPVEPVAAVSGEPDL